jgi:hypothetical protein
MIAAPSCHHVPAFIDDAGISGKGDGARKGAKEQLEAVVRLIACYVSSCVRRLHQGTAPDLVNSTRTTLRRSTVDIPIRFETKTSHPAHVVHGTS